MTQPQASVVNLHATIAPKSDQLNADDLIGRTLTIKVTKVSLCGEPTQPIAVHYEGDNGKPYKPCKSMRRVMVHVWGGDGNLFVGRRMTLFRDDRVQFGGDAVGGIRISHMSDIDREVVMALTMTRANRKPYTVKPLPAERAPGGAEPTQELDLLTILTNGREAAAMGSAALTAWWGSLGKPAKLAAKATLDSELKATAAKADAAAEAGDTEGDDDVPFDDAPPADDGFPGDPRTIPGVKTGAQLAAEQEAEQRGDD